MAEEEGANDPQFLGLVHLGWDIAVFVIKPIGLAIGHAVYYLAFSLFFVLRLLWQPLEFLLLPVLYLGEFFLRCFLAPFRFLAKFETLYIYLGIAAVIGVCGGVIISLTGGLLQRLLGLDGRATPQGRTVRDYRKARRKQEASNEIAPASLTELSDSAGGKKSAKRKGKSARTSKPPTILEELDSDY